MTQSADVDGTEQEWAPPGIDVTVAHSARMYDWWLGGKDNFAADRALGQIFMHAIPTIRTMAQENRKFLWRSVRYLVREAGIRQFLDIGTGLPTSPNIHELAQETAPDARVVYVDNDPIVLVHARALLTGTDLGRTSYVEADLRDPQRILHDPATVGTIDLSQPTALMLVAILMLLRDDEDPFGLVAQLRDAVPSGSYLAITHPSQDFNPGAMVSAVAAATGAGVTLVPRTRDEVARFFGDWEMVEPGLVPVMAWRPEDGTPEDPKAAYYWAGMARKP